MENHAAGDTPTGQTDHDPRPKAPARPTTEMRRAKIVGQWGPIAAVLGTKDERPCVNCGGSASVLHVPGTSATFSDPIFTCAADFAAHAHGGAASGSLLARDTSGTWERVRQAWEPGDPILSPLAYESLGEVIAERLRPTDTVIAEWPDWVLIERAGTYVLFDREHWDSVRRLATNGRADAMAVADEVVRYLERPRFGLAARSVPALSALARRSLGAVKAKAEPLGPTDAIIAEWPAYLLVERSGTFLLFALTRGGSARRMATDNRAEAIELAREVIAYFEPSPATRSAWWSRLGRGAPLARWARKAGR